MQVEQLKKKLIANLIVGIGLFMVMSIIIFLNISYVKSSKNKIKAIKAESSTIEAEITNLNNQIVDFRKYSDIWNKMDEKRKSTNGMKIDEVNKALTESSQKHFITETLIKIELPKEIKSGIFDRQTIKVLQSTVNLNFVAIRDTDALSFIEDFTSALSGYKIVTNIEITHSKPYEKADFIKISKGDLKGNITGRLVFQWYAFENKSAN